MIKLDSVSRSQKLFEHIHQAITHSKPPGLSFNHFMELALFAPNLGYYQASENLLSEKGDFVTAPEISSYFSDCLAYYCQPILSYLSHPVVIEIGPGTGRLAATLLLALERLNCLPRLYVLVEISETLKEQQKENLKRWVPHLFERIVYYHTLPTKPIEGIILANEVIDALPVHRFELSKGKLYEHYVSIRENQFQWERGALSSPGLAASVEKIHNHYLKEVDSYISEVRLSLIAWFTAVQSALAKGSIILIDYGKSAQEYYYPGRTAGTLRCYYQHRCYNDPLKRVGLQDITSDVDFTQLATLAVQSDLEVVAFVSQAAFLLATGLLKEDIMCYDDQNYLKIKGQIHQLISPIEMGESCKVMVLQRKLSCDLLSLKEYDQRVSL